MLLYILFIGHILWLFFSSVFLSTLMTSINFMRARKCGPTHAKASRVYLPTSPAILPMASPYDAPIESILQCGRPISCARCLWVVTGSACYCVSSLLE